MLAIASRAVATSAIIRSWWTSLVGPHHLLLVRDIADFLGGLAVIRCHQRVIIPRIARQFLEPRAGFVPALAADQRDRPPREAILRATLPAPPKLAFRAPPPGPAPGFRGDAGDAA